MIKLEKTAIYYNKGNYSHQCKLENMTFYDLQDGLQRFKEIKPKHYMNKKDISIIEEINLHYTTDYGIKRYYKRYDPVTGNIESNYKE